MDTPFVIRAYNLGLKAVPNFTALSEEQIIYYEDNLRELQLAILRGFVLPGPTEKFALLVDLGIITVPDGDPATWLDPFRAKYQNDEIKSFYYYNNGITDVNFPNPSRILKSGDRLWVCAFHQVAPGTTTSKERLAFLKTQNAVFTGAQGAALVWEQKRYLLPRGKWYTSFDERERLWKDADGSHRVPYLNADSDGDFHFNLGNFESAWSGNRAFLCFRDEPR